MPLEVTPSVSDVRSKGQVWTPRWVADAMAVYLGPLPQTSILDPAVGPGVLLSAAKDFSKSLGTTYAYEIDEAVISQETSPESLGIEEFTDLRIRDFMSDTDRFLVSSIISNPPYLRHHKISQELKKRCQEVVRETLGISIDARAGLHIYFLVKALSHIQEGGKISFLVPADTFEGVFSQPLWEAISSKFHVEGILTFDPEAAAFPGVDTNASVVFIENRKPTGLFKWLRWAGNQPDKLADGVRLGLLGNFKESRALGLKSKELKITDAIMTGFTRLHTTEPVDGTPLNNFATMMRGVATGNNDFFVMNSKRIKELGLSKKYFVRTVPRVRDATEPVITSEFLERLDRAGRPTYLLTIDETTEIEPALQEYLTQGAASGVNTGALVSMRRKWYLMEKRIPVPILFAYLGRRNNRFIETVCDVTPLTGFLCVYPKPGVNKNALLQALNHPSSIKELSRIGKSYGDGAVKVEPGGLRKMIIPKEALIESGLQRASDY